MADIIVGSTAVDVVPSARTFAKQLAAQIDPQVRSLGASIGKQISDQLSKSIRDGLGDGFRTALPESTRQGKASGDSFGGEFARNAKAKITAALKSLPTAQIGVATTEADQKLKDLRAQVQALDGKSIGIDISDADALAEIRRLSVELNALGAESPSIQVRTDTAAAAAHLAEIAAAADALDGKNVDINMNADSVRAAVPAVGMLGLSIAALGPVIVPITAAVAGLGAALLAPLGAAAGGIGALAGSLIGNIKSVTGAQKDLAAAQKSGVSAAAAQVAAQSGVRSALDGLKSAHQSLAQARITASRSVESAERNLASAQMAALSAQLSLNDARKAARDMLAGLSAELEGAALNEAGAALAVRSAQAALTSTLADPKSTQLEIDLARQALAEAQFRSEQAVKNHADVMARAAEERKAGVEGSDQVKTAKDRLVAANQGVTDSEEKLKQTRVDAANTIATAQQRVAAAQRQVATAQASAATAGGAYATAQAAIAAATTKLTGPSAAFAGAITVAKNAWTGFLGATKGPSLGLATAALGVFADVMPALAPVANVAADAVHGLVTEIGDSVKGPGFQGFLDFFTKATGPAITGFGHILGDLGKGFAAIAVAFAPVGASVMKGVQDWAKGFANIGDNPGLTKFVNYIKEVGPQVAHTLASVIGAVVHLGVALAPIGAVVLKSIKWLADEIRKVPTSVLTAIAAAILGVVVALTAINLIMAVNPISLVVIAIAALVAGLIYAYQHSETFRTIVQAVWAALQTAISAVWGVIQPVLAKLGDWLGVVLPVAFNVLKTVFNVVFTAVSAYIRAWWTVASTVFGLFKAFLENVLFPVIRFLWNNVVKPVFEGLGNTISFAWNRVIKPIFQALGSFISDVVAPAFKTGVAAIGKVWDGLKEIAKKPVNFVIETVYNNGLRKGFNFVASHLGLKTKLPEMAPIGGGSSGPAAGQSLRSMMGGEGPLPAGVGGIGDIAKTVGGKAWSWLENKAMGPFNSLVGKVGSSPIAQMASSSVKELASGALAKLKAAFDDSEGDGTGSGPSGVKGKLGSVLPSGAYSIGMPYHGYPGHNGADYPASIGTPVFAPWAGKVTGSYDIPGHNQYNNTPYASYGRVVKIAYNNGMSSLFAHLSARRVSTGENVSAGQQVGNVGMNGNATGPHLHAEFNGGSTNPATLGLFDNGGWLMPGAAGVNLSSKPEPVFSDEQWATLKQNVAPALSSTGGATPTASGSGFDGLLDAIERGNELVAEQNRILASMPKDNAFANWRGVKK